MFNVGGTTGINTFADISLWCKHCFKEKLSALRYTRTALKLLNTDTLVPYYCPFPLHTALLFLLVQSIGAAHVFAFYEYSTLFSTVLFSYRLAQIIKKCFAVIGRRDLDDFTFYDRFEH